MVKFYGVIGYGESVQTAPGVWKDVIVERTLFGDVLRNSRKLQEGESVNNDLTVGNRFSVVADAYANENFHAIRYVKWMGGYWTVADVVVEPPRLILTPGGVYNGPKATAPESP